LNHKNNHSYQVAVDYLGKIHKLMTDMGKEAEFKQNLTGMNSMKWRTPCRKTVAQAYAYAKKLRRYVSSLLDNWEDSPLWQ
jgi:G:T/U-mismatch repair DNA glycosylase